MLGPDDYDLISTVNLSQNNQSSTDNTEKKLPKGRAKVGADLLDCALDAGKSETALKINIMALPADTGIPTNGASVTGQHAPIAWKLYRDPYSFDDPNADKPIAVQKFVLWFVAEVELDQSSKPVEWIIPEVAGSKPKQDFRVERLPLKEAMGSVGLTDPSDRETVSTLYELLKTRKALADAGKWIDPKAPQSK